MLQHTKTTNQEVRSKFCLEDIEFIWDNIYSVEEMDTIKDKIDKKVFTPKEVRFLTRYKIATFYNNRLEKSFRDSPVSIIPSVYDKEFVRDAVMDMDFESKGLKYLNILVSSKIITSCGDGYLFDNGQILITDKEHERALDLILEI